MSGEDVAAPKLSKDQITEIIDGVVERLREEKSEIDLVLLREVVRQTVMDVRELLPPAALKPVVICCSQSFKPHTDKLIPALREHAAKDLKKLQIFAPNFKFHKTSTIRKPEHDRLKSDSYAVKIIGLVYEHLRKIGIVAAQGGVCFIYNPLGYIGTNTIIEHSDARRANLVIVALAEHATWVCKCGGKVNPRNRDPKSVSREPGEICLNMFFQDVFFDDPTTEPPNPEDKDAWNQYTRDVYDWLVKHL